MNTNISKKQKAGKLFFLGLACLASPAAMASTQQDPATNKTNVNRTVCPVYPDDRWTNVKEVCDAINSSELPAATDDIKKALVTVIKELKTFQEKYLEFNASKEELRPLILSNDQKEFLKILLEIRKSGAQDGQVVRFTPKKGVRREVGARNAFEANLDPVTNNRVLNPKTVEFMNEYIANNESKPYTQKFKIMRPALEELYQHFCGGRPQFWDTMEWLTNNEQDEVTGGKTSKGSVYHRHFRDFISTFKFGIERMIYHLFTEPVSD